MEKPKLRYTFFSNLFGRVTRNFHSTSILIAKTDLPISLSVQSRQRHGLKCVVLCSTLTQYHPEILSQIWRNKNPNNNIQFRQCHQSVEISSKLNEKKEENEILEKSLLVFIKCSFAWETEPFQWKNTIWNLNESVRISMYTV